MNSDAPHVASPSPIPAILWGSDHTQLGEIATVAPAPHVGLAISKGRLEKAYRHTDPNEDAVAAVIDQDASLLVLADGHNGFLSAQTAVREVLRAFGEGPLALDIADQTLVDVFHAAHRAVVRRTGQPDCPTPESRTTLAVALVGPDTGRWASMGDSAVWALERDRAHLLSRPESRFIGYPMDRASLSMSLQAGAVALKHGDAMVLASDGFVDFTDPPDLAVAAAFAKGSAPERIAHTLVQMAFQGGAGDNVSVAVALAKEPLPRPDGEADG